MQELQNKSWFTCHGLLNLYTQRISTERSGSVVTHETRIREVPGSNSGADQPDGGFPQSSRQMLGWIFITTIHLTIIHQIHLIYKNQCLSVCACVRARVCVPYRSPHRSSDRDETFTSCCKHPRGGFGNLRNLKFELPGVGLLGVALSLKSTHRPSDCDETFRNCCKHARGGFGN